MKVEFLVRRAEAEGIARDFRLYVPPGYDRQRSWPAVLFLHGAGERGNDSAAPTNVGIGPALKTRAAPYPAFVIFPQCPADSHWSAAAARAIAVVALAAAANEFRIDESRVALTGISMGAAGAWLLASEAPGRFMSLAPVCGWLSSRTKADLQAFAKRIAGIPAWIFHGSADDIVPVEESRIAAQALESAGANVRYTELAGVGHNSWDAAYQESALLEWMITKPASTAR